MKQNRLIENDIICFDCLGELMIGVVLCTDINNYVYVDYFDIGYYMRFSDAIKIGTL